jgi:YesN/AraC family two-component response regulator
MTLVFHSCCFQYVQLCTCNVFTYTNVNRSNLYTVAACLFFSRCHCQLCSQNLQFCSAKFQSKIIFPFLTQIKAPAFLHDTFSHKHTHTHTHTRCKHHSTKHVHYLYTHNIILTYEHTYSEMHKYIHKHTTIPSHEDTAIHLLCICSQKILCISWSELG